ncbi:MAG: hypothetical protein ACOCYT_02115 [Chloroflexota bacterium]
MLRSDYAKRGFGLVVLVSAVLLLAVPVSAQDETTAEPDAPMVFADEVNFSTEPGDLIVGGSEVVVRTDAFGQPTTLIEGQLLNTGTVAYTNLTLFADLLDTEGAVVGEGIGFVVNACGSGLLGDFVLQPGSVQPYSMSVDVFEDGAQVAAVQFFIQGTETEPVPPRDISDMVGLTAVSEQEVVDVEWIDETTLRFGVGCDADAFTYLDWYEYDLETGDITATIHPDADQITEGFLSNLRIASEEEYRRSYLDFAPRSDRVVFQSSVNHFYTANPNGTNRSFIWDNLSRHSLHGIIWQDNDVFLAYYYGAYGEDVLYFTGSATAGRISRSIYIVAPSEIIPGPNTFGTHVVIAATFDDVTGYWYRHVFLTDRELLFEADPPGNNWPAPIYEDQVTPDPVIYIARPVDGEPRLQCFNMDTDTLTDLTEIPLNLTTDDRAWTWLSPDGTRIALSANGVDGGLWVIDLAALPSCLPQTE